MTSLTPLLLLLLIVRFQASFSHRIVDTLGPREEDFEFRNLTSQNIFTSLGQTISLTCKIKSTKGQPITWIKRDFNLLFVGKRKYVSSNRYLVFAPNDVSEDWILQIDDVQLHDAGIYACQDNSLPITSDSISLHVNYGPAPIMNVSSNTIDDNDSVLNLTCTFFNLNPSDVIFWFVNGSFLNSFHSPTGSIQITNYSVGTKTVSKLVITNLSADDAGTYTCRSSYTEATSTEIFKAHDETGVDVPNNNVTVHVGRTAEFHCKVEDLAGEKIVSWIRKQDSRVLAVGLLRVNVNQRFTIQHNKDKGLWTLGIMNTKEEDSGAYECTEIAEFEVSPTIFYLDVTVPTAEIFPEFHIYANEGSTINLTCIVNTSTDILWYFGDRMINVDTQRGVIQTITEHTQLTRSNLLITKALLSDSGTYRCQPSNAYPASKLVHILAETIQSGADNINTNVTLHEGKTVEFHCKVEDLTGEKVIVWKRKRDSHILTSGLMKLTSDRRFNILHNKDKGLWTLRIMNTKEEDSGAYECCEYSEFISSPITFHLRVTRRRQSGDAINNIVTTTVGKMAVLQCEEKDLPGTKRVNWIRKRDGHILTVGLHTYTIDERFSPVHDKDKGLWNLQIMLTKESDSGAYECTSSFGSESSSSIVHLRVSPPPVMRVSSKTIEGSDNVLNLTCTFEDLHPSEAIFWYFNGSLLNSSHSSTGRIQITNVSVSFKTISILSIFNASAYDVGNYSCRSSITDVVSIEILYSDENVQSGDGSANNNVTVEQDKTAKLHCKVKDSLGDKTVSWLRRRDHHLLTVGEFTYTTDQRISTEHKTGNNVWTLQIRYAKERDSGEYECSVRSGSEVSTTILHLHVKGE